MLLIGFTLALLCFSSAAAGALLNVQTESVSFTLDDSSPSLGDARTGEFLTEPYISIPPDQFEIITTLAPDQLKRVEEGTSSLDSGKSSFQTPEPPAIVMFLIGAGLIAGVKCLRTAHRPGYRRVRKNDRLMAHI
jgi:hypothetical protein